MEPSRYLAAILRRWIVIVLIGLLGLGGAALLTAQRTPHYRASTSLFFSVSGASTVSDLSQGAAYTQNLMQSFGALATTASVLDPVNQQLGLHLSDTQLAHMVHVKYATGAVILQIYVIGPSANQAAAIANGVAAQLAKSVSQLSPAVSQGGAKQLSATIVAPAPVPRSAIAAGSRKKVLVEGLVGGLVLGALLVLLREATDPRVRNERELRRVTGAPLLGRVAAGRRPLLLTDAEGRAAEAVRALRANVFAIKGSGARAIVVTSGSQGEGSTTTAINLALMAAETGRRVLLIEADLRHPSVARVLGLRESSGLMGVLANGGSWSTAVQTVPGHTVDVLPAGGTPANPGELISSPEMAELVATVIADYDFVVFDAAALLTSTDAAVLARYTDGALVVVDARRTKRQQLAAATAALHRAAAPLLGVVLNKTAAASTIGRRSRDDRPPTAQPGHPKVQLAGRQSAGRPRPAVRAAGEQRRSPRP